MSTRGKFGWPWRRRNVVGATVIVAFVVVSLLTLGAASGRPAAQHSSGDRAAAGSAMSSTHLLSRAQADASLVSRSSSHASHQSLSSSSSSFGYSLFPALGSTSSSASRSLASISCCGADSTIADASGFEDADGNLASDTDLHGLESLHPDLDGPPPRRSRRASGPTTVSPSPARPTPSTRRTTASTRAVSSRKPSVRVRPPARRTTRPTCLPFTSRASGSATRSISSFPGSVSSTHGEQRRVHLVRVQPEQGLLRRG